jgi:hypothetical protein
LPFSPITGSCLHGSFALSNPRSTLNARPSPGAANRRKSEGRAVRPGRAAAGAGGTRTRTCSAAWRPLQSEEFFVQVSVPPAVVVGSVSRVAGVLACIWAGGRQLQFRLASWL